MKLLSKRICPIFRHFAILTPLILWQVMRMKTPDDIDFSASVIDIPAGIKLEDFGPTFYDRGLEKFGSDIKTISNKKISHKDGKAFFICTHAGAHALNDTNATESIFQRLNIQ